MQTITVQAIQERLGIPRTTVCRYIRDLKIETRPDLENPRQRRVSLEDFERIKRARGRAERPRQDFGR